MDRLPLEAEAAHGHRFKRGGRKKHSVSPLTRELRTRWLADTPVGSPSLLDVVELLDDLTEEHSLLVQQVFRSHPKTGGHILNPRTTARDYCAVLPKRRKTKRRKTPTAEALVGVPGAVWVSSIHDRLRRALASQK
jgi:hypothetical protein